jgi:hypothetical protein
VEQVQRMLLIVADGAHDLVRPARHAQAGLTAIGLGGGDERSAVPVIEPPGCLVGEPARRLHVAEEIGARVLDRLEAADGMAELRSRARMLEAQLEDALDTRCLACESEPEVVGL